MIILPPTIILLFLRFLRVALLLFISYISTIEINVSVLEKLKWIRAPMKAHSSMTTENKYTTQEIFELLGRSLILLQNKQITVSEIDDSDSESKEVKQRVSLVDYIVRAVADELIDRWGETDKSIAKALDDTQMEFGEIAYAKISKCLAIYNDIR